MADSSGAQAANPVVIEAGAKALFRPPIKPTDLAAHGFVGALPTLPPPALPGGSSHLTFQQWSPAGGPMVFPVVGNAGISTLTGMSGTIAASAVEYTPLLGALAIIISLANSIQTSKNDAGSPVGTRFGAAVSVTAGTACAFVSATDPGDGEQKWFPLFGTAP